MSGQPRRVGTTCSKCGFGYPFGDETTIFLFKDEPHYNFLTTTCPKCGAVGNIWDVSIRAVRYMREKGYDVQWKPALRASTQLIHRRLIGQGWRPRLTTSELKLVRFYRHLMSGIKIAEAMWPESEPLPQGDLEGEWPDAAEMVWLRQIIGSGLTNTADDRGLPHKDDKKSA